MKKNALLMLIFTFLIFTRINAQEIYNLYSPDSTLRTEFFLSGTIIYNVWKSEKEILNYSEVSMDIIHSGKEQALGTNFTPPSVSTRSVSEIIPVKFGKRKQTDNSFNELRFNFKDYSLTFRAYNEGIVYRWSIAKKGEIKVVNDNNLIAFKKYVTVHAPIVGTFHSAQENNYSVRTIGKMPKDSMAYLPVLAKHGDVSILILESDLHDYPGMYVRRGPESRFTLRSMFAGEPKVLEKSQSYSFDVKVLEYENFIAKTVGPRNFPWRAIVITEDDRVLADNDLVYKLASPQAAGDWDWVQPGKVAWDWWNGLNLTGVDFKTGMNYNSYKYFIDFAAENKIQYVIFDEDWAHDFNPRLLNPEMDVKKLISYAREKNVKVILWCVWHVLEADYSLLDDFAALGAAGIKVDFIDRDDRWAINFMEKTAREAAKRKLTVDFHGCDVPTGLHRTYPNILNYEGVMGNEFNRFSSDVTSLHNVSIAFIRQAAGPMDYTPGAMRNVLPGGHKASSTLPAVMTTRCHQLGMYIVYDSPLSMLCDAPTAYQKYPDILRFIAGIPTVWDETKVVEAKYPDYIITARQSGNEFYLGGIASGSGAEKILDTDFLTPGNYKAEWIIDGINANRNPEDYKTENITIKAGDKITVKMAPHGGFVIKFTPY